ncbi:MAG: LCP family protein [Actinobacteria bacterium]|nr:LCP family protein [Actinomycetota bacterium]
MNRLQSLPTRAWIAAGVALAVGLVGFSVSGVGAQEGEIEIHKTASAETWGYADPVFIAIVGTDDRPGVSGARADAIHVVGINQAQHLGTIINIPRDTYVELPGHGRRKINESHTLGKAELVGQTLSQLTGASVGFVITTNFEGFTNIVNDKGGVDIEVPYAITDSFSGASVPAGAAHMSGEAALAYSRARHGTPRGDFSRTSNQGLLLLSALRQVQAGSPGPKDLIEDVVVLLRHLKTTAGVSPADLYLLAGLAASIPPENILSITMPGTTGSAGGGSVVFPTDAATPVFADFADDGIVQTPPAEDGAGNRFG